MATVQKITWVPESCFHVYLFPVNEITQKQVVSFPLMSFCGSEVKGHCELVFTLHSRIFLLIRTVDWIFCADGSIFTWSIVVHHDLIGSVHTEPQVMSLHHVTKHFVWRLVVGTMDWFNLKLACIIVSDELCWSEIRTVLMGRGFILASKFSSFLHLVG